MARRGEAKVFILADASGFHATLRKSTFAAMSFAAKMQAIGGQMQRVGRGMTFGITVPLALAGAASVKMAMDFDTSMNRIRGLVGASTKQMETYRKSVLDLAGTTAQAPKDLADALYYVTSSGLKGQKAIDALKYSAMAATAGLGELTDVSDALTTALNVYAASGLTAKTATSAMVVAVREGKMEAADMAKTIGQVVGAAQLMGVSFQDVAGAMAYMSLRGIDAYKSSISLNQMFTNLYKQTPAGTEALKKLGISAKELRDSLRDDGMLGFVQKLRAELKGMSKDKVMDVLTQVFGNARSARSAIALVTGDMGKLRDILQKTTSETGAIGKAFKVGMEDPAAKLRQAWADLQVVMIDVGNKLMPTVLKVAEAIGKLVDWFNKLPEGVKNAAVQMGVFVAALGPVVWIGGGVIKSLVAMSAAYKAIKTALVAATAAQAAFNVASTKGGLTPAAVRGANLVNKGAAGIGAAPAAAAAAVPLGVVSVAVVSMAAGVMAGMAVYAHRNEGRSQFAKEASDRGTGPTRLNSNIVRNAAGQAGVQDLVYRLIIKGGSGDRALNRTSEIIADIQKAAAKGIELHIGEKQTIVEMMQLRHELIKQLDITGKQADRILHAIFGKEYKLKADPKPMSKAAMQAQSVVQHLQDKLRDVGNMRVTPSVVVKTEGTGTLAWVRDTIAGLKSKTVTLTMLKDYGYVPPAAMGGVVRSPQLTLVGEAGPEAIIPLTKPRRAAEVMQQAGLVGGGTTFTVNVVLPGGTTLIGEASRVGEILAPHVERALERSYARAGRMR